MHIYIYDNYISKKKYSNTLSQIETRLTDLGLSGRIIRLNITKSIEETIENEIKLGAKTIISIGNDKTIYKTINAIMKYQNKYGKTNIPIGIIPIGDKNIDICFAMGIKNHKDACNIISARRIKTIKIGQAENKYFLTHAKITAQNTNIQIKNNYSIEIKEKGEINVINLSIFNDLPKNIKTCPYDDVLELYIKTKNNKNLFSFKEKINRSLFFVKNLSIFNKKESLILDNYFSLSTPVFIKTAKEKINFIVGKNRTF